MGPNRLQFKRTNLRPNKDYYMHIIFQTILQPEIILVQKNLQKIDQVAITAGNKQNLITLKTIEVDKATRFLE